MRVYLASLAAAVPFIVGGLVYVTDIDHGMHPAWMFGAIVGPIVAAYVAATAIDWYARR